MLLELAALPPASRVHRLVVAEQLGLLPWALEVAPGRRLVALGSVLISENEGNVSQRELKNRPTLRLLLELGARLSLARRAPARRMEHRPLRGGEPAATLHTAVSRLRVAMAEPDWIITHDDGYSLAPGVQLLAFDEGTALGPMPATGGTGVPPPDITSACCSTSRDTAR